MTDNTRIIKAAADFLNDIARVSRMSKENCQVADNHAQELYGLLVRPEPKQEPVGWGALIAQNRKNISLWNEIAEDGDEGNEPLGAVIRALEKTTDALANTTSLDRELLEETLGYVRSLGATTSHPLVVKLTSALKSKEQQ